MFDKIKDLLKNNIQVNQTIILSFILIIWVHFYNLDISYLEISFIFLSVIILDLFFIKFNTGKWIFPFSWLNAWFWIAFFLRSSDLIIYFFAALLAIVWKHIFKVNWKHFMNPSNMGVFLVLVLFPQYAWINSLQWWNYTGIISYEYILIFILVFLLWIFISLRVYKFFKFTYLYDLILPFFLLHSILFFIIPYYETFSIYLQFFNVSFFIFTFFMLTDPKTVPKKSLTRVFYSFSIVLTFYILQFFINEGYSILWALFINTLLLPLVWKLEQYSINKFITKSIVFYLLLLWLMIISILVLVNIYPRPDLVFDNLCNQLICR